MTLIDVTKPQKCVRCSATIRFIQTGVSGTGKWVTNPNKPASWRCGNDPDFPVRTHSPYPAEKETG